MNIIETLFGEGKDLTALQMGMRAFVMVFIGLIMVRIAGMRTFGKNSAFDVVISIMLGAVLGRAIVGVSPFLPVVIAGLVMVLVHRLLGMISLHKSWIEKVVKGEARILFKSGKFDYHKMKRSSVSEADVMESVRLEANLNSLDEVEEAQIETNGRISIIKKKSDSSNEELQHGTRKKLHNQYQ